jgi:hypothetical protein
MARVRQLKVDKSDCHGVLRLVAASFSLQGSIAVSKRIKNRTLSLDASPDI